MNDFEKLRFDSYRFTQNLFEIKLIGSDVESFLKSQVTSQVSGLGDHSFELSALLNHQGRIKACFLILKQGKSFTLLSPLRFKNEIIQHIHKFVISEDVEIASEKEIEYEFNCGPKSEAKGFLGRFLNERCTLGLAQEKALGNEDLFYLSGYSFWVSETYDNQLLNNSTLYEFALFKKKGCYPGQETVSKIALNRGALTYPMLLENSNHFIPLGKHDFGEGIYQFKLAKSFYSVVNLRRELRVIGTSIIFNHQKYKVKDLPLNKFEDNYLDAYERGHQAFLQEKNESAIEHFNTAIELNPKFADAYEAKGVIFGREKKFKEGIEVMKELLEVDPDSVMANTNLSLFYMNLGEIQVAEDYKAKATLANFKKLGEDSEAQERKELEEKARKEELERRKSMFKEVLAIDSEDSLANYGLGSLLVEEKKFEEALPYLKGVLAVDEKYSVAYQSLGKALVSLKRIDEAKKILIKGIEVATKKGELMPANQMQQLLIEIGS